MNVRIALEHPRVPVVHGPVGLMPVAVVPGAACGVRYKLRTHDDVPLRPRSLAAVQVVPYGPWLLPWGGVGKDPRVKRQIEGEQVSFTGVVRKASMGVHGGGSFSPK